MNQRYHFSFEVEKLRIVGLSVGLTVIKITTSRTKSELPMLPFRRLKKKRIKERENLALGATDRKQGKQK